MKPDDVPRDVAEAADRLRRLEARLARERAARQEAERLLETKSLELYEANQALAALAADLELRVAARTHELSDERARALELAERDALTGIANRALFRRRLRDVLEPLDAGACVGVLLIDLDDFKTVNDTLGHAAGDELLVETARRLEQAVGPGPLVARLGGDEFSVIVRAGVEDIGPLAERLRDALRRPASIAGRMVPCGASIGFAVRSGTSADDLLRDADLALYAAKRAGRGRVAAFEPSMRADLERRSALEAQVREAVRADQIEPWYQPVWRHDRPRFIGAEVLARWHVPDGQVRSPSAFLGAVEALGLLDTMMENMLRRAFTEATPAVANGALEYLSVNVSPAQFNQGWALHRLPALLEETGFPADALMVEITETALLQDIDGTRAMLKALTASGMRIALDDFGIGYSNFSLLRQLPFHALKLDRTLVQDIERDDRASALAECILDLAARLNIKVIAEGVETPHQAERLSAAGCATMQGFWFARPRRALDTWFGRPGASQAAGQARAALSAWPGSPAPPGTSSPTA